MPGSMLKAAAFAVLCFSAVGANANGAALASTTEMKWFDPKAPPGAEYIGCYNDGGLLDPRRYMVNVLNNKDGERNYFPNDDDAPAKCMKLAQDTDPTYDTFALQDGGECWACSRAKDPLCDPTAKGKASSIIPSMAPCQKNGGNFRNQVFYFTPKSQEELAPVDEAAEEDDEDGDDEEEANEDEGGDAEADEEDIPVHEYELADDDEVSVHDGLEGHADDVDVGNDDWLSPVDEDTDYHTNGDFLSAAAEDPMEQVTPKQAEEVASKSDELHEKIVGLRDEIDKTKADLSHGAMNLMEGMKRLEKKLSEQIREMAGASLRMNGMPATRVEQVFSGPARGGFVDEVPSMEMNEY